MSAESDNYDLFLSYRWCGDVAYEAEGRGWVSGLRDALHSHLAARLQRDPRIFLDAEEMRHHLPLHQALRKPIESAKLFLSIISDGSEIAGSWARWELDHFANCASSKYGLPLNRIFKLEIFPTKPNSLPSIISDYPSFRFFYRMGRDSAGSPYPCPVEHLTDISKDPGKEFVRLVKEIGDRLSELDQRSVPDEFAAPQKRVIYVASGDLAAKRQRLCEDLRNKKYEVTSETPWPGCTPDQFQQYTARRLVECYASIHISGLNPEKPEAWTQDSGHIQLLSAISVASRPENTNFRVYVWEEPRPREAPSTNEEQSGLGSQLRQTSRAKNFSGKDWEFALSNIFIGISQNPSAQREEDDREPSVPVTHRVFVHCLEDDREHAQAIRTKFQTRGVWVWFLPQPFLFWHRKRPRPEDAGIRSRFQRFYRECDGAIVLFGHAPEIWAMDRCDEFSDFFREKLDYKAPGICVAPPEDDRKKTFEYPRFSKYPLARVDDYLQRLLGSGAAGG